MTKDGVLRILEAHVQSDRTGYCKCGWRPTWPDERIGAVHYQYREHLAKMIVENKLSENVRVDD